MHHLASLAAQWENGSRDYKCACVQRGHLLPKVLVCVRVVCDLWVLPESEGIKG